MERTKSKFYPASKEIKFEKYYQKIYKSNFNGDSPFLKKKVSNSSYSKSYENFASNKIRIAEQLKAKCPKCDSPKKGEDSNSESSFFHEKATDYCRTIVKNNNFFINAQPFEKRLGIKLISGKKDNRNLTSPNNTYQKIKKEWVQEFFWKKYNLQVPLKQQKYIRESLIKQSCDTEENNQLQMYKAFNSKVLRNILTLSQFKKELERKDKLMEQRLEIELKENSNNHQECELEKEMHILEVFSKHLLDENFEVDLRNPEKEAEIFKKVLAYQYFLTDSLLKQSNTGMALVSDVIFKMMTLLYENASIN